MSGTTTRWRPTPHQFMVLEELYRRGLTNPNASQIRQITAHLSFYGEIQGKNVFYWFQNHKARDRMKLRKKLAQQLHHQQLLQMCPNLNLNNYYLQARDGAACFRHLFIHSPQLQPTGFYSSQSRRHAHQGTGICKMEVPEEEMGDHLNLPKDVGLFRRYYYGQHDDSTMITQVGGGPTFSRCNKNIRNMNNNNNNSRTLETLELFPLTSAPPSRLTGDQH